MPLFERWPVRDAAELGPFYAALENPDSKIRDVAPPNINGLVDSLPLRRAYVEQYIDRERLCELLRASHERRGAPSAVLNVVDQLKNKDVFLVVTGQQPGLVGGPMYTLYKAAQTIALAKLLSEQHAGVFLPAFWNASEDHDFDEIATARWINKDRSVESFIWERQTERRPLFTIPIEEFPLEDLIQRIDETTHPSEFKKHFFETMRECYKNALSYPDFFDGLLWHWFGDDGLMILRPDDEYVRSCATRIISDEINQPAQSSIDIAQVGERLQQNGLPQQLHKNRDRAAFFLIHNKQREALRINETGFETDSGDIYSAEELQQKLETDPNAFSPSAILRPVIQDAVFPTVAAVLGPGETGYHFLLDGVYSRHQVPRPVLVARLGMTLLESRDRKTIEKWNLSPNDLEKDAAALLKQLVSSSDGAPDRSKLDSALSDWFESMKERAASVDPTIAGVLDKNSAKIQKELDNSGNLLLRRIADKETQTRTQIEALQAALLPDGVLQERSLSVISYYLKHGPALIEQIKSIAQSTSPGSHVYVEI